MTHTHQQTKTPQPSSHLPAQSTWARPAPAFEADHDDMAVQDIETQLANADRLGHHIEDVPIQAQTIAQRFGGAASFTLDDATASRINRARGSGQSLPDDVLRQMGDTLDYDFSGVRVHTGSEAHELNKQLYARAFTTGQDVFFRDGEYSPGSSDGQQLIMHELAHVVQQGTAQVRGNGSGMTVRPAGDAYEEKADTMARRVVSSRENRGQQTEEDIGNQATSEYEQRTRGSDGDGSNTGMIIQRKLIKVVMGDMKFCEKADWLWTSGLGPCVGVAAYSPETGKKGLAHIPATGLSADVDPKDPKAVAEQQDRVKIAKQVVDGVEGSKEVHMRCNTYRFNPIYDAIKDALGPAVRDWSPEAGYDEFWVTNEGVTLAHPAREAKKKAMLEKLAARRQEELGKKVIVRK
jgi:hypothetical protein